MSIQTGTISDDLRTIVGDMHLHRATSADAVDGVQPQYVVAPSSPDQAAQILHLASQAELSVIPRGNGTKRDWGAPPRAADIVLSTHRLDQVLEHAWGDMTATVQAGCTISTLQSTLAEHGQRLALDPLWPQQATLGGVLATNDSGALRQRFGGLRDLILGATIVLPDGTLARSGGKVVKNVAGYDLPKLMTGAWGTLGVIVEATVRLYPLPHDTRTLSFGAPDGATAQHLVSLVLDSTLVPVSLQLRAASDAQLSIDVHFEGITAALDAQAAQLHQFATSAGAQATGAANAWGARQSMWDGEGVVAKLTFLPASIANVLSTLERIATPLQIQWTLVAQAVGTGMLRLHAPNDQAAMAALALLRRELQQLDGTLVVLRAPLDIKTRLDVWGDAGDALPLMRRVRERFDPNGMLNPGRFLGL